MARQTPKRAAYYPGAEASPTGFCRSRPKTRKRRIVWGADAAFRLSADMARVIAIAGPDRSLHILRLVSCTSGAKDGRNLILIEAIKWRMTPLYGTLAAIIIHPPCPRSRAMGRKTVRRDSFAEFRLWRDCDPMRGRSRPCLSGDCLVPWGALAGGNLGQKRPVWCGHATIPSCWGNVATHGDRGPVPVPSRAICCPVG